MERQISLDRGELRNVVRESLRQQGFKIDNGRISAPADPSKQQLRKLHRTAVLHRRQKSKGGLQRHEQTLIQRIATGDEIQPKLIKPRLVEVKSGSEDELLFRYASLHWSIPVSSGYGRRLRFLVEDETTDKLIGLIGLGDPVFGLSPRDVWVDWNTNQRQSRLVHVLDAFVLGAVPPYSFLLCGKLIAMLVASRTVRETFRQKYQNRKTLIAQREIDGRVALITTTSALGRSSIYNRLRLNDGRHIYRRVGYTSGSGEFHFSNGVYGKLRELVEEHADATAKHDEWGSGFRNRREVIRKALPLLNLSGSWIYHGVKREIFVIPLARNSRPFLRGETDELDYYDDSVQTLTNEFKDRWLLPRLDRFQKCEDWCRNDWLLWTNDD